jgi:predicted nucleic-acid-binding protein
MIAVDTNVLLRLLTRDDAEQTAAAEALLARHGFHLLPAVLMEAEWVLRSRFRWSRAQVNQMLTALLDTEGVTTREPALTRWALSRHAEGADLADMLHLAEARGCDRFATFDRALAEEAGEGAPVEVVVG